MSTWADAVGASDNEPTASGLGDLLRGASEAGVNPLVLNEEGAPVEVDCYFSSGPEPPAHVRRLRYLGPDATTLDVCRRGEHAWWWVRRDEPTPPYDPKMGWSWSNVAKRYPSESWGVTEIGYVSQPVSDPVAEQQPVFKLGGQEPPPSVVRVTCKAHTPESVLARCSDGGWNVVLPGCPNPEGPGWAWSTRAHVGCEYIPLFPPMDNLLSDMTASLARALPDDGKWYRVATWQSGPDDDRNGLPVWAMLDDDGDWDAYVNSESPDDL